MNSTVDEVIMLAFPAQGTGFLGDLFHDCNSRNVTPISLHLRMASAIVN